MSNSFTPKPGMPRFLKNTDTGGVFLWNEHLAENESTMLEITPEIAIHLMKGQGVDTTHLEKAIAEAETLQRQKMGEPEPEPAAEPVAEVKSEPVAEVKSEPVAEVKSEPAPEVDTRTPQQKRKDTLAAKKAGKPAAKPVAKPAVKPAAQATKAETVAEPEPTPEPTPEAADALAGDALGFDMPDATKQSDTLQVKDGEDKSTLSVVVGGDGAASA